MSLQKFIPTPKFEEYRETFKDFFTLDRREDGVLLAQAHTLGGPIQLSVQNHRALGPDAQGDRRRPRERAADPHRHG